MGDVEGEGKPHVDDNPNKEEGVEGKLQKIQRILRREFDVEILHKWRELRILEDEYDKAQQLRLLLEKMLLNDQMFGGSLERSSSLIISQPVSRAGTPSLSSIPESPKRPFRQASIQAQSRNEGILQQEKTSGGNEPGFLYEMCPDGSIVRLRCPSCGAERFRSTLGMVNHCRINCGLLVSNPDDRIQHCGIPVSRDEVPSDFFLSKPIGHLKKEKALAEIRAGVQAPIIDTNRKPMIREFEMGSNLQSSTFIGSNQVLSSIASHQADVESLSSRYYTRKRIVIGNFTRNLETGLGEAEAAQQMIPTHEWRLYLRPHDLSDDISSYVKAVKFHLHPSYKPNDVVTVAKKPFELVMTGWGEFPARIEVIFVDSKNKPVEFIHYIRLRSCISKTFQLMSEQAYDIDLDRKTRSFSSPKDVVFIEEQQQHEPTKYTVDDALGMTSRLFPLFGSLPKQSSAVYNRAVSYAEFMKLSSFDQQALEKERALALQRYILPNHPDLTVEYVLDWCRRNGLSPVIIDSSSTTIANSTNNNIENNEKDENSLGITLEELKSLQYCRYCGLAHFPQDKFDVLQKNCSMRPRKLHLSSRTTAAELVSNFNVSSEPLPPEPKRQKFLESPIPLETSESISKNWTPEEQWVNHSIGMLELPSYLPRKDTCSLLERAVKCFLKDVMEKGLEKLPNSIERAVGRPALLTPLHLYQAIAGMTPITASAPKDKPEDCNTGVSGGGTKEHVEPTRFDFLSNSFMAGS